MWRKKNCFRLPNNWSEIELARKAEHSLDFENREKLLKWQENNKPPDKHISVNFVIFSKFRRRLTFSCQKREFFADFMLNSQENKAKSLE